MLTDIAGKTAKCPDGKTAKCPDGKPRARLADAGGVYLEASHSGSRP